MNSLITNIMLGTFIIQPYTSTVSFHQACKVNLAFPEDINNVRRHDPPLVQYLLASRCIFLNDDILCS